MKNALHFNYYISAQRIYCEWEEKVVVGDEDHYNRFCSQCPHFVGTLQGEGVECAYDDSSVDDNGDGLDVVTEPYEQLEKRRKARRIEYELHRKNFVVGK